MPDLHFPKPAYAVSLRRSALAAALHADAEWGAIAVGLRSRPERLLLAARGDLGRRHASHALGHPTIGRGVYQWLDRVRHRHRPFLYWFQKYSIDGSPGMGDAGGGPDRR